jgi:hypothetical protein
MTGQSLWPLLQLKGYDFGLPCMAQMFFIGTNNSLPFVFLKKTSGDTMLGI